ncbi:hypothetical protein PC117_g26501 [Phytophthora cactorum]|nr:hypothetical protein PC117_g26501 [Phytophthora cactorum]
MEIDHCAEPPSAFNQLSKTNLQPVGIHFRKTWKKGVRSRQKTIGNCTNVQRENVLIHSVSGKLTIKPTSQKDVTKFGSRRASPENVDTRSGALPDARRMWTADPCQHVG